MNKINITNLMIAKQSLSSMQKRKKTCWNKYHGREHKWIRNYIQMWHMYC